MKYLEGELEHCTLTHDAFAIIAKQQRPAHLDLAVKLLSYRAFGRFIPTVKLMRALFITSAISYR